MQKLDIDADIARAHTPPAWLYTDPAVHAGLCERIFARSWQFAADVESVRVPGQCLPFTLLEGCLNEPLLLTRDADDALHCMSNVCTHRAALVCEQPSNARFLRCRYHGRRFGLDGKFQHMPEFEQTERFPTAADDLARVRLERWGPLLFVALGCRDGSERAGGGSPLAPPVLPSTGRAGVGFDEWIGPVRDRIGWLPLDEFRFDASRSRDYLVRANWMLYCENYLEGFHIPFVHASLAETIDYGSYRTELFRWGSVQIGVAKGAEHTFDVPAASPDHGQRIAAYYFWLFPNLMLNFYPWGLSINVVKPLGFELTRVSFLSYVLDAGKLDVGAGTGLDRVEREDEAVVEAVQRGLRSRLYLRGRYSPTRETGTHHLHRLLMPFVNEPAD